jgi:hypothetical protein
MGEFEPPIQKEPIRDPKLSVEADDYIERLTGPGGMTYGEAYRNAQKRLGNRFYAESGSKNGSGLGDHDAEIMAATQRMIAAVDAGIRQPAPPKSGETDDQIRQRHAETLRNRRITQNPIDDLERVS